MVEHPKSKSNLPRFSTTSVTLYFVGTCLQSLDADHGLFEGGGVPREEEDVAHDHDGRCQAQPGHVRGHRVAEQHDGERERRREEASHNLLGGSAGILSTWE